MICSLLFRSIALPPDASIVHDVPVAGPSTHVLVIGVGSYPFLLGGNAAFRLDDHQGLGQLSSPPVSARAVAAWFPEQFRNSDRPLSTVRLLVSEATPTPFVNPSTSTKHQPPPATIDNISDAIKGWKESGSSDPGNLVIFYFCGHGLAGGADLSLLAEDFGSNPDNALDAALDFRSMRLGMSRCEAKQQLYLVDACRTEAEMTRYAQGYAGRPVLLPRAKAGKIDRPVIYSTMHGEQAHGRAGLPSHFAQALLAGLRGAGGDRMTGKWRVGTGRLHLAIDAHLARLVGGGLASAQIPTAEDITNFDIHHLAAPPEVPVVVTCDPRAAQETATLRCSTNKTIVAWRSPQPSPWEVALPVGTYDFEATLQPSGRRVGSCPGELVYPPEQQVKIEVTL